jgi:hypothetical protein
MGVFEEVTGLPVDLEWPVLIEAIDIESVHTAIVLQPLTSDYGMCPVTDRSAVERKRLRPAVALSVVFVFTACGVKTGWPHVLW